MVGKVFVVWEGLAEGVGDDYDYAFGLAGGTGDVGWEGVEGFHGAFGLVVFHDGACEAVRARHGCGGGVGGCWYEVLG